MGHWWHRLNQFLYFLDFITILAVSDNFRPFLAISGHFWAIFVPELKFVADQSCDHSKRSQEGWNFDGYGFWSHFEPVEITLGNFGVILVPFQVHFGPICGPELKLSPTSHVTTENDRKGSRFLMKMVSEVTLMTLRPFQALFYNFGVICCHSRPQNDLNVLKLSLETIIIGTLLLLQSFWVVTWLVCYKFEFRVNNGLEWSRNGPKIV